MIAALEVPVAAEADVVVVGGGPGGFAAALKAARMGASVVLMEKFDMPGGVHTAGLQGAAGPGAGGIHTELMERFDAAGYIYTASEASHPGWAGNPLSHYERNMKPGADFARASFNPEGAGNVMAAMLEEAGVQTFYDTAFVDAEVKEGTGTSELVGSPRRCAVRAGRRRPARRRRLGPHQAARVGRASVDHARHRISPAA